MVAITELMDANLLEEMLSDGTVKVTDHPNLDLRIYNYTAKAQYENVWNEVTRQCRGLITDHAGTVIARPFPKFFNLSQLPDDQIPSIPFEVYEKIDGSLGILYPTGHDTYAIATRGSFVSDQAVHATALYQRVYAERFAPQRGITYLFEIVYPANRIVVDYHGEDDLFLLDIVDNGTGLSVDRKVGSFWPGRAAKKYEGFAGVHQLAPVNGNDDQEGYVLKFSDGRRVKFKFDEYSRLHRIITNVSSKTIWEILSSDRDLSEVLERVPDEFYHWVKTTAEKLDTLHLALLESALTMYGVLEARLPAGLVGRERKKVFAELVKGSGSPQGPLFALYEGKSIDKWAWDEVRPDYERPFTSRTEDVN